MTNNIEEKTDGKVEATSFLDEVFETTEKKLRLRYVKDGQPKYRQHVDTGRVIASLKKDPTQMISLKAGEKGEHEVVGICLPETMHSDLPTASIEVRRGTECISVWLVEEVINLKQLKEISGVLDVLPEELLTCPVPGFDGWEADYSGSFYTIDELIACASGKALNMDQKVSLAVGKKAMTRQGKWNNAESSLQTLVDKLQSHEEGKKDGLCFLQGRVAGGQRTAKSVVENYIIGFDLDTGETAEEIDARLAKFGHAYVRYSTHSHLKNTTEINRAAFFKWLGEDAALDATPEQVSEFLIEKRGYRPDILKGAKIKKQVLISDEGALIVVKHKPIEKHRLVFVLKETYVFQGKVSQDEAIKGWRDFYHGFGSELGFVYDQKCTDPSRLFYFPRHPKGAEFSTRFVQGSAVRLQDYRSPEIEKNVKVAGKNANDAQRFNVGATNLQYWAKENAAFFEIEEALTEHAEEDTFRNPRTSGFGIHIQCPFEDEHSKAGGQGTFIMSASENDEFSKGFVIQCSHDGCSGRDRLDFLKGMIEQEWLPKSILKDEEYYKGREEAELAEDDESNNAEASNGKVEISSNEDFSIQFEKVVDALANEGGEAIIYGYGTDFVRLQYEATDGGLSAPKNVCIKVCGSDELTYEINQVVDYWPSKNRKGSIPPVLVKELKGMRNAPFPNLERIVNTPIFSRSGNLLNAEGYDADTGFFMDMTVEVPDVPEAPSRDDIARARNLLIEEALFDFPFNDMYGTGGVDPSAGQSSRANTIALILQPFARMLINGSCPGYFIDKPAPGTGAGYLADVVYIVNEGRRSDGSSISQKDEEINKVILALLRRARSLAFFDNINHKVDSGSLAILLTQDSYTGRILGKSEEVTLPVRQTMIFTGNNASFSNELTRRLVPIRIDAMTARPESRDEFKHDPLQDWLFKNRADLIWACLVIIQNWLAVGSPTSEHRLASFEAWAQTMGGILEAAGIDGFLENLDSFRKVRNEDVNEDQAFVELWFEVHGNNAVVSKRLIELIFEGNELVVNLPVKGYEPGEKSQSLAQYLKNKLVGRTFDVGGKRLQIVRDEKTTNNVAHWALKSL